MEDHIKLGVKKALPVTCPASLGNLYHPVFYSCLQTHFSELLCMTEPIFSRTTGKLLGNYGNIQKCFLLINECLFEITTIIFPWVLSPLNGLITKKRSINHPGTTLFLCFIEQCILPFIELCYSCFGFLGLSPTIYFCYTKVEPLMYCFMYVTWSLK